MTPREKSNLNLMPIEEVNSRRSREKHSEDSRKAGIKSGESRRARKTFRESLLYILEQSATPEQKAMYSQIIQDTTDLTQRDLINLSMAQKAIAEGDVKAAQFVRDSVGEMPTVKQEVTNTMSEGDKALLEKVSKRLEKSVVDGQKGEKVQ